MSEVNEVVEGCTEDVNTEVNEAPVFQEIPAKIAVKIGKRTRYFENKEDAVAALERFNAGPRTQNKGIMEARKKAKAEREAFEAPIVAYLEGKGYEGRSLTQRTKVIAEYLKDQEEAKQEGGTEDRTADVAEDSVISETVTEPVEPNADPLADLL